MSRMEKKLVVVASKSLFEVIPQDAEDYENTMLWRGLYQTVGAGIDEPLWQDELRQLWDEEGNSEKANIQVQVFSSCDTRNKDQ